MPHRVRREDAWYGAKDAETVADTTLTDPMGRTVVLRDRTWFAHVLRGHREVGPWRDLAENAVASPREIRYSMSDANCRIYYGRGPESGLMIAVVADVELGVVKTVYLARKPSPGDVEWS
jgi:hypothetical protein